MVGLCPLALDRYRHRRPAAPSVRPLLPRQPRKGPPSTRHIAGSKAGVTSRRGSNVRKRCKVATRENREWMTRTAVADYKISGVCALLTGVFALVTAVRTRPRHRSIMTVKI